MAFFAGKGNVFSTKNKPAVTVMVKCQIFSLPAIAYMTFQTFFSSRVLMKILMTCHTCFISEAYVANLFGCVYR